MGMAKATDDWFEYYENFLTGCLRSCPYCNVARMSRTLHGDIARNKAIGKYTKEGELYILDSPIVTEKGRQDSYPFGFMPTLHRYRYQHLDDRKMGSDLFISAWGDMFENCVPDKYINEIFEECLARPRHIYMFMTKNPKRYKRLELPDKENFWYGTSVSRNAEIGRIDELPSKRNTFVAIEPILQPLFIPPEDLYGVNWVIIGAEQGRSGKIVVPEEGWITDIALVCENLSIPVFLRPSLLPIIGESNMRREKPEIFERPKRSRKRGKRNEKKL